MNRLSLWLVGVAFAGGIPGWARAADPAPAQVPPALPRVESPAPLVGPDGCNFCCAPEGCARDAAECGDRRGLVGGVGLYWVQPQFSNNPAFTVSQAFVGQPTRRGATRTVTDSTDIVQHMEVAPQLWLGYVGESGLGARARWWSFSAATSQGVAVPAGTADNLTSLESAAPLGHSAFVDNDSKPASLYVTSKLRLEVWDAEALAGVQAGCWDLLLVGGMRYAQISQHYDAHSAGDTGLGTGFVQGAVLSVRTFNGLGPTAALEARRSLGDSGLALYGSARGSILFGDARQHVRDIFVNGAGTFFDDASNRRNDILPVGELELGLEFSRAVGGARAFGQVAAVAQQWWGAGSASRAVNLDSFGVPVHGGGTVVDSDLGFFGVAFRLGLNY